MSGAAPLSPELVEEFTARTGITVHQGYGLTEAAPVVTSTLCSRAVKPGSVGRGTARGLHPARRRDRRGAVEGEDPGEIHVARRQPLRRLLAGRPDGPVGGWLATGDVGFLDADGDLFLVDRLKEIVIVSGFNVYPSEIEDVLADVDGVLESAVVGVPDELTGEAVVAYVRRDTVGSTRRTRWTPRVAARTAQARLARFKQPSRIEVVDGAAADGHRQDRQGPAARRCGAARARAARVSGRVRGTLYGKPGCHLCDDARAVVEEVCAELGEAYVEVDITTTPSCPPVTARRSR